MTTMMLNVGREGEEDRIAGMMWIEGSEVVDAWVGPKRIFDLQAGKEGWLQVLHEVVRRVHNGQRWEPGQTKNLKETRARTGMDRHALARKEVGSEDWVLWEGITSDEALKYIQAAVRDWKARGKKGWLDKVTIEVLPPSNPRELEE